MIAKKAIKDIQTENCNLCPNRCTGICRKCHYGAAIKALEKQIPKKPVVRAETRIAIYAICPHCGSEIKSECSNDRYCIYCGQRLKWE